MDPIAKASFIIAQAACANAKIAAMQAVNQICVQRGEPLVWNYADFMAVQDEYYIGHNTVIGYLRE